MKYVRATSLQNIIWYIDLWYCENQVLILAAFELVFPLNSEAQVIFVANDLETSVRKLIYIVRLFFKVVLIDEENA